MSTTDERVAVVTGERTGIGVATVRLLAGKGLAVVLVRRQPELRSRRVRFESWILNTTQPYIRLCPTL